MDAPVMKEQGLRFGRAQHLVGVLGLPSSQQGVARTGVIVLNAGFVHRIGPFRLHVDMTRKLNATGYPTLRFDVSALGDSGGTDESQPRRLQTTADITDAMKLLGDHTGCQQFVLVGLCSGAANAHIAASLKKNIAGAIFLDGYVYRTAGFRLRRYLPKIFSASLWRRLLSRSMRRSRQVAEESTFGLEYPPQRQVRTELSNMLGNGMKLYFIYSGGSSERFNHRRQFRECFGRLAIHPEVDMSFFEEADHTYILTGDRARLLLSIDGWLQKNFPITLDVLT